MEPEKNDTRTIIRKEEHGEKNVWVATERQKDVWISCRCWDRTKQQISGRWQTVSAGMVMIWSGHQS